MGSHMERLGSLRVLAGAVAMYLSIPNFILFHTLLLFLLLQCVVSPLLGLDKIRLRDRIILDRYRVEGLAWIDKFNCCFCGFANGQSVFLAQKIAQVNSFGGQIAWWKKLIVAAVLLPCLPLLIVVHLIGISLIYNLLVAPILGMHRLSGRYVWLRLRREGYGERFPWLGWLAIRLFKYFSIQLDNALEQIESAWCPIRHLEQGAADVYPPHHKNFLEAGQTAELREILLTDGTVSPRKPRKF
ncbi:MAG: hypothetical protein ABFR97_09015 [Thermodesulfobacteriota bacterium]